MWTTGLIQNIWKLYVEAVYGSFILEAVCGPQVCDVWSLYMDRSYCSGTKYGWIRARMFVWNSGESRVEEQTVIKLPLTSSPQVSNNISLQYFTHSLTRVI